MVMTIEPGIYVVAERQERRQALARHRHPHRGRRASDARWARRADRAVYRPPSPRSSAHGRGCVSDAPRARLRRPDRRRRRRRLGARLRARGAAARRRARRGASRAAPGATELRCSASRRSRTARSRSSSSLDLWSELEGYTEAIRSIHISERGRFGAARIDASEEHVPALGYTVENQALGRVLWERLAALAAPDGARARDA